MIIIAIVALVVIIAAAVGGGVGGKKKKQVVIAQPAAPAPLTSSESAVSPGGNTQVHDSSIFSISTSLFPLSTSRGAPNGISLLSSTTPNNEAAAQTSS